MRVALHTSFVVAALCTFALGCTATRSGGAPDGGGGAADGGGAATGSALTCPGIIECGAACPDNDTACTDACVAKGSPAAKSAVDAVVTCVTDNACQDSACFQTKCPKQIEGCVASGSTGGDALTGSAPAGNVPGDLVGKWHSHDDFYEFKADGTVARVTAGKVGSCKSSRLEKGTAVTEGASLTIYFTSSVFTICDKPGNSSDYVPNSEGFTYLVEPSTVGIRLVLAAKKCSYTDPAAASFYCSTSYDKE